MCFPNWIICPLKLRTDFCTFFFMPYGGLHKSFHIFKPDASWQTEASVVRRFLFLFSLMKGERFKKLDGMQRRTMWTLSWNYLNAGLTPPLREGNESHSEDSIESNTSQNHRKLSKLDKSLEGRTPKNDLGAFKFIVYSSQTENHN